MNKILYPAQVKYLKEFKDENDPLINKIEDYAKKHKVPILSWDSAAFLEQLIQMNNPKLILEIGTAIGYSSIRIARNFKRKGLLKTIEISPENIKVAKLNIAESKLEDKIEIIEGDALQVMPRLKEKFDFIFLDADKKDYKKLFDYALILLKSGGIIFVDNLLWHGYAAAAAVPPSYKSSTKFIRDFNRIFTTQPNLNATILPIGDGVGLGIKK